MNKDLSEKGPPGGPYGTGPIDESGRGTAGVAAADTWWWWLGGVLEQWEGVLERALHRHGNEDS